MDAQGKATCDPAVLENTKPAGSLLPVGGKEYGHKGYGLSLMVEALTQGLAGHGRLDAPKHWGGNVYIQLMDADFFAGRDAFLAQMNHTSDLCRSNPPIEANRPVRVPGDQATKMLESAKLHGLSFAEKPWSNLYEWAQKLGVRVPRAIA
jgi:L-lactate dehydrogenase